MEEHIETDKVVLQSFELIIFLISLDHHICYSMIFEQNMN